MKNKLLSEIPIEALIDEILNRSDTVLICVGNKAGTAENGYHCSNAFKGNENLLFDMINRAVAEINGTPEFTNNAKKYRRYLQ